MCTAIMMVKSVSCCSNSAKILAELLPEDSDGRLSDFHKRLLSVNKIVIITIIVKIQYMCFTYVCIAIKITISPCIMHVK